MNLFTVTLTGADESVEPGKLLELSKEFPFVEWGILISPKRQGREPRYPSHNWQAELRRVWFDAVNRNFQICAHLCGQAARDVFGGEGAFFADAFNRMYGEVQLNGFSNVIDLKPLIGVIRRHEENFGFIMQVKDQESHDRAIGLDRILFDKHEVRFAIAALYDISGGMGVMPQIWPDMPMGIQFGYAGGIGPANVESVLTTLSAKEGQSFSIDMESSLRSRGQINKGLSSPMVLEYDRFDLQKARQVLEIASRFVVAKDDL